MYELPRRSKGRLEACISDQDLMHRKTKCSTITFGHLQYTSQGQMELALFPSPSSFEITSLCHRRSTVNNIPPVNLLQMGRSQRARVMLLSSACHSFIHSANVYWAPTFSWALCWVLVILSQVSKHGPCLQGTHSMAEHSQKAMSGKYTHYYV